MLFEAFFSQKSSAISVSSKLFLQSFFFKAFSSKLFFSPQSLLFKAPLQSPLSQSLSLKAPPSKPLLSKPFSQSAFLKASSSKPFLQSALLKALSLKTLRSKPLPSLQSVSPKAFSSKLLFTSLCKIFSKTLFADLDIPCSKQLRETRQTIRQKCLHFDGNIIGIRKFVALRQLQ